ncbi:hypothetical protein DSO57_1006767 [Entomophthora muscae]|uniref:Uncharacterized protein n=1 Tax=Entomophthora muscae TaxID=34485 RepID=A0ACC2S9L5_9FUNG|nr:hypothetical protein DSO57_1006767 [Entomophthora muscae]
MSMYEANNQDKAITLLTQLDAASTDLIILHMPGHGWSYTAAKSEHFMSSEALLGLLREKNEFLMISFKKDNTITDFADRFYHKAQILMGLGSLTVHDAHIALHAAVKHYKALYCTLMPAF